MPDHVHMLVSIPPKYAVSSVVGYIKGKSAIYLARSYGLLSCTIVRPRFAFASTAEEFPVESRDESILCPQIGHTVKGRP